MAYDRYDPRGGPRDDRSRWSNDRFSDRERIRGSGRDEDRGFFERAGDEIASWFGDDDAERRRERDHHTEEGGYGASRGGRSWYRGRDDDRGFSGSSGYRGHSGSGGGFRDRSRQGDLGHAPGLEGSQPMFGGYTVAESIGDRSPGYRPMTGDYGRNESLREQGGSGQMDPHYHSWRRRQIDELDRDYDDYRRENQARFDDDFTQWRGRRQQKRSLLGQIREHMDVVGNDDEHVGTGDRTAGDRLVLTRSDSDTGGAHHSLSCSDVDRIEGDRVILDCSAEQAKQRWRDESRGRALFEREDQGEMGPRVLNRSFEGTYR